MGAGQLKKAAKKADGLDSPVVSVYGPIVLLFNS
jgi:hypothetical protein